MNPGFRIGSFEICALLGAGGMATVWRVRHLDTGTPAALKALHLRGRNDVQSAFALEVRALARTRHPHVVHIYDHGVLRRGPLKGAPYLVSELCSGGDLRAHRERYQSWPVTRELIVELLAGLGHAHGAGILHRDLKMGNVLFSTAADVRPGSKLADFGIASVAGEKAVDFGTPEYTGPELHRGYGVGPPLDLYALAVLVWRLSTGEYPFEGSTLELAKLEEHCGPWVPLFPVPSGLEGWLRCLLRADPANRHATARDALVALPGDATATATGLDPETPASPQTTSIPSDPERRNHALPAPALSRTGISLLSQRQIPLLGRTTEIRTLWSRALKAQQHRSPQTIAVTGPRGAGHTALVRAFLAQLSETSGALVLSESPSGRPGHVVLESLLASALGLDEHRLWTRARQTLELRAGFDPRISAGLDQIAAGHTRFLPATLAAILSMLSQRRTVVVWLDGPREPMLQRFVQEASQFLEGPILIGVSGTETAPPLWPCIELEPLPASTLAVALQHLAPIELDEALAIAERSGGRPAPAVRRLRTRFRKRAPTAVTPSFDETDWTIVRAAVALGGRVPRVHLATVADVAPERVVFLEEVLVRDGLATVHRDHWLLEPALERAVEQAPDAYTHAARWALALADDRDADPLARVRCLLKAGRTEEATELALALRRRIHQLHGQLAELTVVRQCLRALEVVPPRSDLHGALWVREVRVLGDREGTIDLGLQRALQAAKLGWMEVAAQCLFATAFLQPMTLKRDLLDQALAHAPPGSLIRGKTLHSLAFIGARHGEPSWRAHAAEALEILTAAPSSAAKLHELSLRRFLAREDGDFALAVSLGRAVVGLARTDDPGALDMHLTNLADCHIRQGELDQADHLLQEAAVLAELTGEASRLAAILVNALVVAGKRQDWAVLHEIRVRLESQNLHPHVAGVVETYALLGRVGLRDLEGARGRLAAVRAYIMGPHEREPDVQDGLVMAATLAKGDTALSEELFKLATLE